MVKPHQAVWRAMLPSAVDLYDIRRDPPEKTNLASANPDKVASLHKRANELARAVAKPLFLTTEFDAMRKRLAAPPALPSESFEFNEEH